MSDRRRRGSRPPPPSPPSLSSSRGSLPAPDVDWSGRHRGRHRHRHHRGRRHSGGQIDFRPLGLQRAISNDTLRRDLRQVHPPLPPRGGDDPLISALPRGYNPNSGLMDSPSGSDSEYGDHGPYRHHNDRGDQEADGVNESGSPLPLYDDEERFTWANVPGYLRQMPDIYVHGSGFSSSASSAPPYVEEASDDARSSAYAPSAGTRSRASSLHSQHRPEDTLAEPSATRGHHSRNQSLSNREFYTSPSSSGVPRMVLRLIDRRSLLSLVHPNDAAPYTRSRSGTSGSINPPPYSDSYGDQPDHEPHSLGRHRHRHFGNTSGPTTRSAQASRKRAFVPMARTSRLG